MIAGRFTVPASHPCLPGHFPGRPVVPAALLLDEALALIAPHLPGTITGLDSAKFLRPVRPGDEVEVVLEPGAGTFDCRVEGRTVARGQVAS